MATDEPLLREELQGPVTPGQTVPRRRNGTRQQTDVFGPAPLCMAGALASCDTPSRAEGGLAGGLPAMPTVRTLLLCIVCSAPLSAWGLTISEPIHEFFGAGRAGDRITTEFDLGQPTARGSQPPAAGQT